VSSFEDQISSIIRHPVTNTDWYSKRCPTNVYSVNEKERIDEEPCIFIISLEIRMHDT
jgi:thymidylate synthase